MRKYIMIGILGITIMLLGFTGKLPAPVEGVYTLKLKTLTLYDFDSKEMTIFWNFAELTDSKPDFIEISGIDETEYTDIKYGCFQLGNNEQKVWFMMARNDQGFWDEVYIDQNLDDKISKKEKIKSFKSNEGKERGSTTLESFSLVPVPLRVSYKGITREYEQDLYFFISTIVYQKKNASDLIVRAIDASFLEGQLKIEDRKSQRMVNVRIMDADGNGCFNDYGKDVIIMDLNHDHIYRKNEYQKLAEFFDSTGPEKNKRQLRINFLPFSLKLAVTSATNEFDYALLEPKTANDKIDPDSPPSDPITPDGQQSY